jgi:hypothetical protein
MLFNAARRGAGRSENLISFGWSGGDRRKGCRRDSEHKSKRYQDNHHISVSSDRRLSNIWTVRLILSTSAHGRIIVGDEVRRLPLNHGLRSKYME